MEDPNGLLRFIASNVENLRNDVAVLRDDVTSIRSDVTSLLSDVTSLRADVDTLRADVGTLRADVSTLQGEMGSTRADVARLESKMDAGFEAVRGDIERVHLRVDGVDRNVSTRFSHFDTDVGRLRSAVYLLAKDRPDVLRLLGSE